MSTWEIAAQALSFFDIDELGLDAMDVSGIARGSYVVSLVNRGVVYQAKCVKK